LIGEKGGVGTLTRGSVVFSNSFLTLGTAELILRSRLAVSGLLPYEQWRFPVLSPTGQSNFTASLQLTFYPNWRLEK
jgi:hypothetical protein